MIRRVLFCWNCVRCRALPGHQRPCRFSLSFLLSLKTIFIARGVGLALYWLWKACCWTIFPYRWMKSYCCCWIDRCPSSRSSLLILVLFPSWCDACLTVRVSSREIQSFRLSLAWDSRTFSCIFWPSPRSNFVLSCFLRVGWWGARFFRHIAWALHPFRPINVAPFLFVRSNRYWSYSYYGKLPFELCWYCSRNFARLILFFPRAGWWTFFGFRGPS